MSAKDVLIFVVVACMSAAFVFGAFMVYRVGSVVMMFAKDAPLQVGSSERAEVERGKLTRCLSDPLQYGWYYPERCVEEIRWSVDEYDQRGPTEVVEEIENPFWLPVEFWVREEVHLARLEVASSFRPDAKARSEVGADLVRLAGEIGAAGYQAHRIPEALFKAGAFAEVVATAEHFRGRDHQMAARAAMMVGTKEALRELKRVPMVAKQSQISVVAGLCLAGEMEEAKERIRFLLEHRHSIRGRGLPLESLVLACGIEPREVGIEEIAATSMDAAEVHALLLALHEDREATKTLVERLERSGEGSFLPALARYIVQQEPPLGEVLEMLGYSRESRGMSLSIAGPSCPGMGSEMRAPLAAGPILEAGARRVLELEAEDGGSYVLRERVRIREGRVSSRQVEVEMEGAQRDASELLLLEAARHYLHMGKREEAREILGSQEEWRRDGSREACLAQLWMELGEWEEVEKWLPEGELDEHPAKDYFRDLMLRSVLLRGDSDEGRSIFDRDWEDLASVVESGVERQSWERRFNARAWPWMAYSLLQSEEGFSILREALPGETEELSFWLMVDGAVEMLALPEEELRRERSKGEWQWNRSMASTWAIMLSVGHLAGPDDVEIWLDGFGRNHSSFQVRGWREMVHRREAARLRGDEKAAQAWDARLAGLLEMVEGPAQVWLLNQL